MSDWDPVLSTYAPAATPWVEVELTLARCDDAAASVLKRARTLAAGRVHAALQHRPWRARWDRVHAPISAERPPDRCLGSSLEPEDVAFALVEYFDANGDALRGIYRDAAMPLEASYVESGYQPVSVDEERWRGVVDRLVSPREAKGDPAMIRCLGRPWGYVWATWLTAWPRASIGVDHLLLSLPPGPFSLFATTRRWPEGMLNDAIEAAVRDWLATRVGATASTLTGQLACGRWEVPPLPMVEEGDPGLVCWASEWLTRQRGFESEVSLAAHLAAWGEPEPRADKAMRVLAELVGRDDLASYWAAISEILALERGNGAAKAPPAPLNLDDARARSRRWARILERDDDVASRMSERWAIERIGARNLRRLRGLLHTLALMD